MTLTGFLLARIAEDEEVARATRAPSTWFRLPSHAGWHSVRGESATSSVFIAEMEDSADASHIARHDPARVLADCEAKRLIMGMHEPAAYADVNEHYCATCRVGPFEQTTGWPCQTLRAIALPYAVHPDYDEAWRP